jgi:hypothetical protein
MEHGNSIPVGSGEIQLFSEVGIIDLGMYFFGLQWRNQGGGKWAIAHFIWRFAHCNFY